MIAFPGPQGLTACPAMSNWRCFVMLSTTAYNCLQTAAVAAAAILPCNSARGRASGIRCLVLVVAELDPPRNSMRNEGGIDQLIIRDVREELLDDEIRIGRRNHGTRCKRLH